MYQETRKMHLIEEVLKVRNEETLAKLETVLVKSKSRKKGNASILYFVGVMSKKETSQMRKAIEETCETVNADDWK